MLQYSKNFLSNNLSPFAWLLRTKFRTLAIETSKRRIIGHRKIALIHQVDFMKEIRLYNINKTGSDNKTPLYLLLKSGRKKVKLNLYTI